MKIIRPDRPTPGHQGRGPDHAARAQFSERFRSGDLDRLAKGPIAGKVRLAEQYRMLQKGDVARRLHLHDSRPPRHGPDVFPRHDALWHVGHHYRGPIGPSYVGSSFRFHYYGPWYFPHRCWYPRWGGWVDWSWHYLSHAAWHAVWDPRPLWCRPVVYLPAPRWVWWEVPVWSPLPVVTSGTWVDVEPVDVGPRYDLQLLAVRFVDPGHPEEQLGPRFRVWFRNNSGQAITQPFDVLLLASADNTLSADLPEAGVRVTAVEAGQVQAVDIRLPIEAAAMGVDEQGEPVPFGTLHVLVDARREVPETSEANNGARLPREEILPVDPAAFGLDPASAPAGGEVVVAGEGFGPAPGQVLLHLGGIEMEAEILGWYDLGVRLAVPDLPLAGPTQAELIVIRGDGAAANPLQLTITPKQRGPEVIPPLPPEPQ